MVSSMSISIARGSSLITSRPFHFGGHRRQDRFDIATGLQPEDGATVVEQIEFDIAPAPDQLFLALLRAPVHSEISPDKFGIDFQEGAADVLREGEIGVPIAGIVVVVEDAADAALLLAVRQVE